MGRHVLITGASAGIGAAIAQALFDRSDSLSLGARRSERLAPFASRAFCAALDVTDEESIATFIDAAVEENGPVDVLINNAGLARGIEKVAEASGGPWREMVETNVFGLLNTTRTVLPSMIDKGSGHVVVIGSIAGHEAYPGGSVYCATKRALQSICRSLRHELLGTGVRVTSIDPGMVDTEFSLVRFSGDRAKARQVYRGTRPLTAADVAECVLFAIDRPPHVDIESMLVMPTDQVGAMTVHRHDN